MDERIVKIKFNSREDRTRLIYSEFKHFLKKSVLDVGCFNAPLRHLLKNCFYVGIDIVGKPNIKINLEQVNYLPFKNNSFYSVICADVLEHLDNLHEIFEELIRVSRKYIIISLPNCWRDARVPIERGIGSFAHYGLPLEKPVDRHKWFFNLTQAKDFLLNKAKINNLRVVRILLIEKPKNFFISTLRKLRYPNERYLNRYTQTIIVLLEKID